MIRGMASCLLHNSPLLRPSLRLLARPLASAAASQHLLIPTPRGELPASMLEPLKKESLFDFLKREGKWDEIPDKVALRCSLQNFKPITYRELDGRVSAAAHALRDLGFKQGDVINIHLHNCEQFVVAFLATSALGGCASTSNPVYTASELAGQHIDSGTKFVLTSKDYAETMSAATAESGVRSVHYIEEPTCFANAPPTDAPVPALERPIDPLTDCLVLPYSSGTTGKPKGVVLTQFNLSANTLQCRSIFGGAVGASDRLVGVLPLFHIYGMTVLMAYNFLAQSELVLLSKFEPQQFLETMQNHTISVGFLVPPIVLFLAKHPMVQGFNMTALRWIVSGAAPLDAVTQSALSDQLQTPILQAWGMTELSPIGLSYPPPPPMSDTAAYETWRRHMGSSGTLPASTQGMVIDPASGASLPPGELGELCISGPQVMTGYLNRPDATAETIRPDGFLRTGDLAYYTEDGYVFITERLKELIKVKGLQVAPAEVEGCLLELDEVADAAVIGVPDERAGELPKAFVVLAAGVEMTADGIRSALGEKLAPHKLPGEVEFVEAIPKSASGKILRKDLRAAELLKREPLA